MRLTRLFVESVLYPGSIMDLARDAGAHLARVLRARSGDELILFNGDGREFTAAIEAVHGSRVTVSVGTPRTIDRESPFELTLVQCVPRGDRMDFIVQKATELGVRRIVPVLSQRSVVRLDSAQAAGKQTHWQAVAVSACEQCGRNRLPAIEAPRPLLDYLGAAAQTETPRLQRLILEPERAPGETARTALLANEAAAAAAGAVIAIGPEGGFAPEELEAFSLAQFSFLALGPRVLRTETAAIAAIAVLQARFGDMSAVSDPASLAPRP